MFINFYIAVHESNESSRSGSFKKSLLPIKAMVMLCLLLLAGPGLVQAQFAGGTGSSGDPYLVETAEHLNEIRNYLNAHFRQVADIDVSPWNQGEGWDPIGKEGSSFTGSYNGNGKTVTHLFIHRPDEDYQGLFGHISGASISNLGLVNVNITGKDRVGGLAGYNNQGVVTGCYTTGSVNGNDNVGGMIGYNEGSGNTSVRILASYTTTAVTGTTYVGGLVGHNVGVVRNCYATGPVIGTGYIGGLTGRNIATIWSSFWDMDTSERAGSSGGKGLTSAQMKTLSIYQNAGWGGTEWVMTEGQYPRLAWENTGADPIPGREPLPFAGSGTETDPYRISTAEEFARLSWFGQVLDAHIVLTSHLDLTGVLLSPFGDLGEFQGVFDGQGYVITNATIDLPESDFVGLFARLGRAGIIKNLSLENVAINGRNRVGALVGTMEGSYEIVTSGGETDLDLGDFSIVSGCAASGTISGQLKVGGLAGVLFLGKIDGSHTNTRVSGSSYLGGLVGGSWLGIVNDSSATGDVNGQGDGVGGLAGYLLGVDVFQHIDGEYKLGSFTDSHASGSVTGNDLVGGLVGESTGEGAEIIRCSSTASVEGNDYVGGLVGKNHFQAFVEGSSSNGSVFGNDHVGGLVGVNANNSLITNCHSANTVQGGDYVGGLVGINESGSTISHSYSLSTVNAKNRVGGLVGVQHSASIQRSFSAGKTTASNWFAGGLVAENQDNSSVNNSYSTSKVTGVAQLGGLAAWNTHGNIINSYATGKITGSPKGGLVQSSFVGNILGSYWDRESTETDTSAGGEGRTTDDMTFPHNGNTFVDWNFDTIWAADVNDSRNHGYPYLRGVTPEPGTITVAAHPSEGGTVGGGGTFPLGTGVTVTADPAENYHFVNWTQNGQDVSASAGYTFVVSGNRELTAHFALDQHQITVSATPEAAGIVSGGGSYSHGSLAEVSAAPHENYRFINWTENGNVVSTSAIYSFTVQGPRDLTAHFDYSIVFEGGSGTEEDPFQVAEALHLYSVRTQPGAYFRQTAHIDLGVSPWNDGEGWLPIGWVEDAWDYEEEDTFNGYFDGNGFTIQNLTINRTKTALQGLFGLMSGGEIRNVVLENVHIRGYSDVGSLVGIQKGGQIINCHVSGQVQSEWHGIGGLVGNQQAGEIEYSSSSVQVTGGYGLAGGLVGSSAGTITKSFATGPVIGSWYAGGFVGRPSIGLIEDCYATGSVTDPDGWGPVGGFAGGERWGDLGEMEIRNCYATGAVDAGDDGEAGGFVAVWGDEEDVPGTIENSYWDTQSTGREESAGGNGVAGKTTAQMRQQATFEGWNFAHTWSIDEGNSYPFLKGYSPIITTGTLHVTITPVEAIENGAQWRRTNTGPWRDSGVPETGISEGEYTVEFKAVQGWDKPGNEPVTIAAGDLTEVSGEYIRHLGSLQVFISPSDAVDAGMQWRRQGTLPWFDSGAIEADIPTGQYVIEFKPVAGYSMPATETVSVEKGTTTQVNWDYKVAVRALPGVMMLLLDD